MKLNEFIDKWIDENEQPTDAESGMEVVNEIKTAISKLRVCKNSLLGPIRSKEYNKKYYKHVERDITKTFAYQTFGKPYHELTDAEHKKYQTLVTQRLRAKKKEVQDDKANNT